jgi:2-iminobutanoate/2-iminopropanoate deaminase
VSKEIISTDRAPQAIGPYSQGVRAGSFVFFSGQIPLDPKTGEVRGETSAEQAEAVLDNIGNLLDAAGLGFSDVVKTTIFMTSLKDFAEVNRVYEKRFSTHPPARSTVEVNALPRGVLVEIEVIAQSGES